VLIRIAGTAKGNVILVKAVLNSLTVAMCVVALAGCGKNFDELSSQEATRALGVCFAYHFSIKKDFDQVKGQFSPLIAKSNVSANLQKEGEAWTYRAMTGSDEGKKNAMKEAEKSCAIAGLPY
jgi:hypothetical protein